MTTLMIMLIINGLTNYTLPLRGAFLSLLLQRKKAKKGARKCPVRQGLPGEQLQGVLSAQGRPEPRPNTLQFAPFPVCSPHGRCELKALSVFVSSSY